MYGTLLVLYQILFKNECDCTFKTLFKKDLLRISLFIEQTSGEGTKLKIQIQNILTKNAKVTRKYVKV
jgi:hypothetical protein